MKVENGNPNVQYPVPGPVDRSANNAAAGSRPAAGSGAGDQVALSSDIQAVQAAIQNAATLPDVRQQLVEQMRELLRSGELGKDAAQLAHSIIERWLSAPQG